ncbi:MAG: arylamine N-acetyltransferase family protein [Novosphingobium sp.]
MPEPLSKAELDAYLDRIGVAAPQAADLATLTVLHRAHVLAIPFENLDVQLGKPPGLDPQAAFAKLVTRRRGGWCYEQNGLFGRALMALGFEVTRLSAGVMRALRGEFSMGSHLALKVRINDADYLADVGFGSSQIAPLPLAEHAWEAAPMAGRLLRTADGLWQFAIDKGPNPLSYDFADSPADEARLAALCDWQARDPESVFVQNLVVQQRRPDGHLMLRGKVLTETGPDNSTVRELGSAEELVGLLRDLFALDVPEIAGLWPAIEARHAALFV